MPQLDLRDDGSTAGSVEAGLDALDTPVVAPDGSRLRRIAARVLPPVGAVVVLVAIWQALWAAAFWPEFKLPAPVDVWGQIWQLVTSGEIAELFWVSVHRAVIGFAISLLIAVPLGLAIANLRVVRRGIGPLVSGLQSLPSVAWVPAAILWFGLTDATVYFVVLMGAVPSIVNGLIAGVEQVPPQLRRVGTVLGAGRTRLATLVVLPAALPGYVAGLKQGWAFSWRSLMAAEIIAVGGTIGFGLGSMLQQSRELADIAGVLATVLVILAIGILIELVFFAPLERRMLRRRGLLQGGTR